MQTTERPEYTYDYHWGRIAVALILLTALIVGMFFLFAGGETSEEKRVPSAVNESEAISTETISSSSAAPDSSDQLTNANLEETASIETMDEKKALDSSPPAEYREIDQANAAASDISEQPDQPNQTSDVVATVPTAANRQVTAEPVNVENADIVTATQIVVDRTLAKPSDTRTKAKLFAETIKRAKLTTQVNRREPGEALPKELTLAKNGLSKVFFYTEVIGEAGKTHYHNWYHEGKLKARVPITIGSDRWRCYSSKYLTNQQTGEWTVKVENAKGKLLAQSEFHFVDQ
ncbi:MAG: DUF2914 domain-containing protein [Pseudomonadales bacterium]|nr:DUF2914 domain-containing protein [Pseudomonadales bacterium]